MLWDYVDFKVTDLKIVNKIIGGRFKNIIEM